MDLLSRIDLGDDYLTGIAVLIGTGHGPAFAPMTNAAIAGVHNRDAGTASGLVDTTHQLGTATGLGVLVPRLGVRRRRFRRPDSGLRARRCSPDR